MNQIKIKQERQEVDLEAQHPAGIEPTAFLFLTSRQRSTTELQPRPATPIISYLGPF